jgi:hypothetical protein
MMPSVAIFLAALLGGLYLIHLPDMQIFQPDSFLKGFGFCLQAACLAFHGASHLPGVGQCPGCPHGALASLASSRASSRRSSSAPSSHRMKSVHVATSEGLLLFQAAQAVVQDSLSCYLIIRSQLRTESAEHVGLHNAGLKRLEDHFSPRVCWHWFCTHLFRADMSESGSYTAVRSLAPGQILKSREKTIQTRIDGESLLSGEPIDSSVSMHSAKWPGAAVLAIAWGRRGGPTP